MLVKAILLGSRFTLYKVGFCLRGFVVGLRKGVVCERGLVFLGFVLKCGFCRRRFEEVMLGLVARRCVVGLGI